ncbi:MAG TPA: FdhF/YdeP family oxidoreductase, partial [Cytophagales bacterium]|nr:FdhF/YdeP family oxidoreductase [Cytophagales bacterium]
EFCENGAKAVSDEATRKRADPEFWSRWTVSELSEKSDHWMNGQGRLTHPMILRPDNQRYVPIDWDDAFELIAQELSSLTDPNRAIFYTSGRPSNEAAFLWQLLARRFGTNNLPDCSNMCHESSGVALSESIGIGKGTVKLDDFTSSDLILVVGQNPGTNHPRMLTSLRDAKKAGASIISINPIKEAGMGRFKHPQNPLDLLGRGTRIADEHISVNINGDFALFRGFAKVILDSQQDLPAFVSEHTHGFDDYRDAVMGTSWNEVVHTSGVDREIIERIGEVIARSECMISCWAMGLTQHRNAVATIQEIANVSLLGGHIGRSGAGLCPVRGHSNVQGDRTVGINHKPTMSFLDSLSKVTGIESPIIEGVDVVEAVHRMRDGDSTVFLSMGGNFLSAMSDTNATASALTNCSLTVQISTKPNRSHLVTGKTALILPCLGRTELDLTVSGNQFVTVENSMGIVHSSIGTAKPASPQLMSEPSIVSGIGLALDTKCGQSPIDWMHLVDDYDRIRALIEQTIPGFDDYNARCRNEGGFYLPNAARDMVFNTHTGKANFIVHPITSIQTEPDHFVMMTIRSHDQYNTTIYGLDDRYRGINKGRRVVLVNELDMEANGWKEFDLVNITSHYGGAEISSRGWYVIPYAIPMGNVATYFPEANVLVPRSIDPISKTPSFKSLAVRIEPMSNGYRVSV